MALELQPSNSDAKQIVVLLERALKDPPAKVVSPSSVVTRPTAATPSVDVSFETQIGFITKVQPILMNKCATCHASGVGGKFHLERVSDRGQKVSTQRNLAAVLTYIDLERPAISPLIVKAMTAHGSAPTAAIRDRSAIPLQTMQQWIEQTVAQNPQLIDYRTHKKRTPAKSNPEPKSVFPVQGPAAPTRADEVVSQPAPRVEIDEQNPPRVRPAEEPRPPTPLTPVDEFDPVIYNSWAHRQTRK
jgi:hypothetical protein